MNLEVKALGSGEMIKGILLCIFVILAYFVLIFSSVLAADVDLFDTEYYKLQFRKVHYVRKNAKGELLHTTTCESEVVKYNKKWWQFSKIEPLLDKWFFDSEETKRMWEKIEND